MLEHAAASTLAGAAVNARRGSAAVLLLEPEDIPLLDVDTPASRLVVSMVIHLPVFVSHISTLVLQSLLLWQGESGNGQPVSRAATRTTRGELFMTDPCMSAACHAQIRRAMRSARVKCGEPFQHARWSGTPPARINGEMRCTPSRWLV